MNKNYSPSYPAKGIFLTLLAIILITCSPVRQYQNAPEVKKWEPDIEKFEALDATMNYPDNAVIFAGSSSIRLWSTLNEDMSPYSVIQRGYGGAKLSDFAVYAGRIFNPHKCGGLVFFIANDITGTKTDKSPEEIRKLFNYIYKVFRKEHPAVPVFYIAITPSWSRWKAWPRIQEGNELMKEWCLMHKNTYFIGTDTAFLNAAGEPRQELFRDDSLHLNADGYRSWTRIIKGEMDKVIGN